MQIWITRRGGDSASVRQEDVRGGIYQLQGTGYWGGT